MRRAEREKRRAFLSKYAVEPKEATEKLILPITDQLFEEGADWPLVEQAARGIMADLWMLKGEQAKALSIMHGAWLRSRAFLEKYGSSKAEVRKDLPAFIEHLAEKGANLATALNSAKEIVTDLGGYDEQQSTEIQNIVREGWLKLNRIYTKESVLTLIQSVRADIAAADAPETSAVLDGLELAVKDYPEGVPQELLRKVRDQLAILSSGKDNL